MPIRIEPAVPADVPALAALLARAFRRDPMVTWPMAIDDGLEARIRRHFDVVDTPFAAEGWLFRTSDGLGAMALIPPDSCAREAELAETVAPAIIAAVSTNRAAGRACRPLGLRTSSSMVGMCRR